MKNRKTENIILFVAMLLAMIIAPTIVSGNNAIADSTTTTENANSSTVSIQSASFVIGMNQYFINNQIPGISMDAAAYIDPTSGRTLVPVRYLADALGATTNWDGASQTVTVTTAVYTIQLVIGSATLTVDGQAQAMDVAPAINNGRTYLPARDVANALGFSVAWDAANRIVIIYPMNSIGAPADNFVIKQAQQNAAKPEQVQKLESALGITMATLDGRVWYYDPAQNADGTPNSVFYTQNGSSSFVTVNYEPGDKNVGSEIDVKIASPGQDSSKISVDISPLRKVLEAFFPGQDAVNQVMTLAQQEASHAQANYGWNPIPGEWLTINGMKVGLGQGDGLTFASLEILGS
jgi:hypothetical protein